MIDLNSIDETQFEELCYDILLKKGFVDLSWRKGTGKKGSPSDNGRDIEAVRYYTEFDNQTRHEKWFVECKHYIEGVPPTAIQGGLAWAVSSRPDFLLIIVSNFLSNPCKEYINDYIENNRPPFRIKLWENKNLEIMLNEMPDICSKYKLEVSNLSSSRINKYHLEYVLRPKFNTVEFLFEILDSYDPSYRDSAFNMEYHYIIKPRYKKPITGKETMGELLIDDVNYLAFKNKILLDKDNYLPNYVQRIISDIPAWLFDNSDLLKLPIIIKRNEQLIKTMSEKIADLNDGEEIESYKKMVKMAEERISELPNEFERTNFIYNDFCSKIVYQLLLEDDIQSFFKTKNYDNYCFLHK